jgi:hypothetical protein
MKFPIRLLLPTLALVFAVAPIATAADANVPAQEGADTAYVTTANGRADKIVATLSIDEPTKQTRVRDIISQQYQDLRRTHAPRDAARKALRSATPETKEQARADLARVEAETDAKLQALHAAYLKNLSAELNSGQIDQVKDGMTYGVCPNTYRVYLKMLPDLTAEQRAQLLAWLTEAREHAIDAGSSDEKHAWFGKYKGKINNYLSKAGIDMKKAEKELLGH